MDKSRKKNAKNEAKSSHAARDQQQPNHIPLRFYRSGIGFECHTTWRTATTQGTVPSGRGNRISAQTAVQPNDPPMNWLRLPWLKT